MNKSIQILLTAVLATSTANAELDVSVIEAKMYGAKISKIEPSSIEGIYAIDAKINNITYPLYITEDGKYLIEGNITDLDTGINFSEKRQQSITASTVQSIDPRNIVTYTPSGEIKHSITVFTDTSCPYCKKLHEDLQHYLNAGIEVKYVPYPIISPKSDMESIWCSENPKLAIDHAFMTKHVDRSVTCKGYSPATAVKALGQSIGITSTPTIILNNGSMLNGYMPAMQMINLINNGG